MAHAIEIETDPSQFYWLYKRSLGFYEGFINFQTSHLYTGNTLMLQSVAISCVYTRSAPNKSTKPVSITKALALICTSACVFSCAQEPLPIASEQSREINSVPVVLPHTDQANEGGWIYNAVVSDEFEGDTVDEDRWFIVGKFEEEVRKPHFGEALPYENITTACFISRKFFTYGYIEIKSKAADAEVTSAFWSMGDQIELDFFEQFGSHRM